VELRLVHAFHERGRPPERLLQSGVVVLLLGQLAEDLDLGKLGVEAGPGLNGDREGAALAREGLGAFAVVPEGGVAGERVYLRDALALAVDVKDDLGAR
jgi:hypothetical protein